MCYLIVCRRLCVSSFAVKSATDRMHHLSKQLKGLRSAASPKWEQLAERKGNGDVDTVGADVYYDATELLVLF